MLESMLRKTVPSVVNSFPKLTTGEPYRFERWAGDDRDILCLYYWFSPRDGLRRNVKRVPVPEILAALGHLRRTGTLDRAAFQKLCPVSESDGPCGFAVLGRTLEALGVAHYVGKRGFELTQPGTADQLLR